jgi:hypothetical protein
MSNEDRKERVLHTRIPAALEEQIKRLAEGLRVPVSNLVRNMLEDAIDMTRRMGATMRPTPRDAIADVYGWQQLVLNVDSRCARCTNDLSAGDTAHVGLSTNPRDAKVFICTACLPHRVPQDTTKGVTHGRQG